MDLVIYATKDGLRTLYSTNDDIAYLIAEEKRSGANKDSSLGGFVYGLSFIESGFVFTKYLTVKDTLRSNALGFIAFSLHISKSKTIKGIEAKEILDKLSANYTNAYIKDNYLNRGEKNLIREDWGFVKDILSEYKEQDRNRIEELIACGAKDPAFIYYKNEAELIEYFDKPFQEEYSDFKQIYFIANDLKDSDKNPLNVLINSGIELKDIDLKNEYFYLNNYNRSKRIIIIANGKERSDGKNNNSIRAKWPVEIKYSKDERCFRPIRATGTLSNPNSEIFKYLELKGNQVLIKWDAFNNPEPKTKSITFIIKNQKGEFVDKTEININNIKIETINGHRYEYKFIGEDLIKPCSISVSKDSYSGKINFIPYEYNYDEIIIQKRIKISILVSDENGLFFNYNLSIHDSKGNLISNNKEFEFIGDAIDETYEISITSSKHEKKVISYSPAKHEKPFHVELKINKIQDFHEEVKYKLIIDEKIGKRSYKKKPINEYVNKKPDFGCDSKYGYKFIEWKRMDSPIDIYAGSYEAVFKKLWYQKIPKWSLALCFFILISGLTFYWMTNSTINKDDNSSINLEFNKIQNYIDGDSLLLDKLNVLKNDFENKEPEIIKKDNGFFDSFMGKKEELDSTDRMAWREKLKIIDEAIFKRELVNNKEFKELLNPKYSYSNMQQPFFEAIKKIDTSKYADIKIKLGAVENKTLTEIVNELNKIYAPEQSSQPKEVVSENSGKTLIENRSSQLQPDKEKKSEVNNTSNPPANESKNNLSSEVIQYIQGGELKRDKLEEYLKQLKDSDLKKSIELILKIWTLDGNNNKYESYQKALDSNRHLKDSELNKILKKIIIKEEKVDYAGLKNANDIIKTLKRKYENN